MKCMNLLAWCFDQWQAKHVNQRPECFASDAKVVGEPTWRGKGILEAKRWMAMLGAILAIGSATNANAGLFGIGGTSWKEEVLLHDGQKIIVERTLERGGRHEIGQRPGATNETLSFTVPGSGQTVNWKDQYSEDIGSSNFNLLMLEIANGAVYLVATPMGCLSYNKWGRPNPPYVVFKYQDTAWLRIPLAELPTELVQPNLVISSPDNAAKDASDGVVSTETIMKLNGRARQPEYQTIQREALLGVQSGCIKTNYYGKAGWLSPDWFVDQPNLNACLRFCDLKNIGAEDCPCNSIFKGK